MQGRIAYDICISDRPNVKTILESTKLFDCSEIDMALAILDETIEKGIADSGNYWLKYLDDDRIAGFAIFGQDKATTHSWKLHLIAVHENMRNRHIGTTLLKEAEKIIADKNGKYLWAETFGKIQFEPTRHFFLNNEFEVGGLLKEYYDNNNDKIIYRKTIIKADKGIL